METLSGEQNRPEEGDMGHRTVFLATGIGASAPNRSFQLALSAMQQHKGKTDDMCFGKR